MAAMMHRWLPLVLLSLFIVLVSWSSVEAVSCNDNNQAAVSETVIDQEVAQIEWIRADPSDSARTEALFILSKGYTLWRSIDEGKTLKNQTSLSRIRAIEPTADPKKLFFLGFDGLLWTTDNQGSTYKAYDTKLSFTSISAHPTEPNLALGIAVTKKCSNVFAPGVCKRDLYTTSDFGATWKLRREYVQQADWGDAGHDGVPSGNIFVITWENPPPGTNQNRLNLYDAVFQRTSDMFATIDYSRLHSVAFLFYKKTVFLAKMTGRDINADLELYTSVDNGETFNRAIFPASEDLQENRYTIVDLSEGAAFVNVDHSGDGSWGTTYGSNGLDTEFAEVLRYTKRSLNGAVDFRRIQGLDGIYLANRFITPNIDTPPTSSSHLRTVISYDKGGRWNRLKAPAQDSEGHGISCTGSCSLNLIGRTRSVLGQFYSTANAPGLILATGSVGPWLTDKMEEVNTYFTRDAGQTWLEAAKGSAVFEFGDHGAITVLASNTVKTKTLRYSWDEGLSWPECDFTDAEVDVENIQTEPSNTARNFILYGSRGSKGVVVHIDFSASPIRQCQAEDYELWSPRGEGCLLGERYFYQRRKQASKCFVEKEFDRITNKTRCRCAEEDYECDFCFRPTRDNPPRCEKVCADYNPATPPATCIDHYPVSKGYRRVPGDKCDATDSEVSRALEPEMRPCPGVDGDGTTNPQSSGGLSAGAIFAIIFLVFFGVFAIAVVVLLVLARTNPRVHDALESLAPRLANLLANFDRLSRRLSSRATGGAGGVGTAAGHAYSRVGQDPSSSSILDDLQQETDDTLEDEAETLDDPKTSTSTSTSTSASGRRLSGDDDDFNPRQATTTGQGTSTTRSGGAKDPFTESLV